MGQCTAVGWVGGTLPNCRRGRYDRTFNGRCCWRVCNRCCCGRRPIYVIRYQGFNWFNAPIILNYACKSKEIWNIPCPLFIRSIGMEGSIGPVAGSSHHSLYYRMPGIKIISPMSPREFINSYNEFMESDDVFLLYF